MASSELLKQIQAGKKLKKAETNDRSAPVVDSKPSGGLSGAGPRLGPPVSAPSLPSGGGPPQLGALFAGGVPKLKPTGQSNPAKAPTLARPPVVLGRAAPSPTPAAPPPPSRLPPPKSSTLAPLPPANAPALPSRSAPALPHRAPYVPVRVPPPPTRVPSPPVTTPAPPRRPPPPPRTVSPPVSTQTRPPVRPSIAVRSASPADVLSSSTRSAPPPPARPSNPPLPARKAPPPPPVRPSSIAGSIPSRAPPPPPTRKVLNTNGLPILPVHVRALSEAEVELPVAPPRPGPSAARTNFPLPPLSRVTPLPSEAPPPRPFTAPPSRQVNGVRPSPPTRKIPSPPPEAGSYRFPTTDFPPPRDFTPETRHYGGGRQRGSDFDLSNL